MAAETIVLHANCKKTEYMLFNQHEIDLKPMSGDLLKQVHDFRYFGSWMADGKKDMKIRIGLAWKALNKLDKIWKSKLKSKLKIQFFRSTVESVLLYGAESWTFTNEIFRLDGTYTRMLRVVLGFTWRGKITAVLKGRRLRSVGHMWRTKEELICRLLIWKPKQGTRTRGRPATTYVHQLINDTGVSTKGLKNVMEDREIWKILVDDVRACSK